MAANGTGIGAPGRSTSAVRTGVWALHLALPLLALWLLIARPDLDVRWEHHPSHFWLVLGVAAINVLLGLRMHAVSRSRGDARLLLVSLAFVASAGFLFLHALATPGVLLDDPNVGFEVATPIGLAVAALLLAVSASDFTDEQQTRIVARARLLRAGLVAVLALWALASLAGLSPLGLSPNDTEVDGPLRVIAVASVAVYAVAALGYLRIHLRRPAVMLIALITASALLAEAMVTVVFARNWQLSWWLWHILMTAGFGFFLYSAFVQYRREGSSAGLFNAISTEATAAQIRAEYGSALTELTAALHRSQVSSLTREEIDLIAAGLATRFDLTERQTEVLARAAEALANEQEHGRRLAALAEVGTAAGVMLTEHELLEQIVAVVGDAFAPDAVRIGQGEDDLVAFLPELTGGTWTGGGDVIGVPIVIKGKQAGIVEFGRDPGVFSDADRSMFEILAAQIAIALENSRLYGRVEGLFRQYMSPEVATALLADPSEARLGGRVIETTALFADLRGFTGFSEQTDPTGIVELLNRYFSSTVPIVLDEGGTVVQFIGDALLAVFNTPNPQHDHARRACRAALRIQEAMGEIAPGDDVPRFRIGINTGPALVGNVGSHEIRSFNVMGDTVNVAARLEAVAWIGNVVIGQATRDAIGDAAVVEPLGELELKGRSEPVAAYRLVSLSEAKEPAD
jgi:adenylate cyclase